MERERIAGSQFGLAPGERKLQESAKSRSALDRDATFASVKGPKPHLPGR